jgi:hypothetical protein
MNCSEGKNRAMKKEKGSEGKNRAMKKEKGLRAGKSKAIG